MPYRLYSPNSSAIQEGLGGYNSNPADAYESPDLAQPPGTSPLIAQHETKDETARVQKTERQKQD